MGDSGLDFHHLGLACHQPERAIAFLKSLGYSIGSQFHDALQNVNLIMCTAPALPAVEVIWPAGPDGPLTRILETGREGLYHICYSTNDRALALAALARDGHRLMTVSPPTPAILFDGQTVSFHFLSGFGLLEVLEIQRPPA
jgi:methylmalonyl-CoA/ethylmalonyl-CoA epimerase